MKNTLLLAGASAAIGQKLSERPGQPALVESRIDSTLR